MPSTRSGRSYGPQPTSPPAVAPSSPPVNPPPSVTPPPTSTQRPKLQPLSFTPERHVRLFGRGLEYRFKDLGKKYEQRLPRERQGTARTRKEAVARFDALLQVALNRISKNYRALLLNSVIKTSFIKDLGSEARPFPTSHFPHAALVARPVGQGGLDLAQMAKSDWPPLGRRLTMYDYYTDIWHQAEHWAEELMQQELDC